MVASVAGAMKRPAAAAKVSHVSLPSGFVHVWICLPGSFRKSGSEDTSVQTEPLRV